MHYSPCTSLAVFLTEMIDDSRQSSPVHKIRSGLAPCGFRTWDTSLAREILELLYLEQPRTSAAFTPVTSNIIADPFVLICKIIQTDLLLFGKSSCRILIQYPAGTPVV
jgi:hypothetical protein